MSVTLNDKAKAAAIMLEAESGDLPMRTQLVLAWIRGYIAGLDRSEGIIKENLRGETP